jgi:hypothetical protein
VKSCGNLPLSARHHSIAAFVLGAIQALIGDAATAMTSRTFASVGIQTIRPGRFWKNPVAMMTSAAAPRIVNASRRCAGST